MNEHPLRDEIAMAVYGETDLSERVRIAHAIASDALDLATEATDELEGQTPRRPSWIANGAA